VKSKKLPLLIALIALIGTVAAFVPQQAFSEDIDTVPSECTLDGVVIGGANDNRGTQTNTHMLQTVVTGNSVQVTYTEASPPVVGNAASQLAIFVLDPPGSSNVQTILLVGGSATATFVGVTPSGQHSVTVCAGDTADNTSLNSLEHILSPQQGEGVFEILTSGNNVVTGTSSTPQRCGVEFLDGTTPVIHASTLNFQPSSIETMRLGNTGNGPAVVDFTEVGDFFDKGGLNLFSGCDARWSAFAGDLYRDMQPFCAFGFDGFEFIEVLPGKAAEGDPRTSVDRHIRTLPLINPDLFAPIDQGGLGEDPIVAANKNRIAVSCTPDIATCDEGFEEVNGACLCISGFELGTGFESTGQCLEVCPLNSQANEQKRACECDDGFFPSDGECIFGE